MTLKNLRHPILDALGGNTHAIQQLRDARKPVEITHADSRSAGNDRNVLDVDSDQDAIVANIVQGKLPLDPLRTRCRRNSDHRHRSERLGNGE